MSEVHHGHPVARGHNKWRTMDNNWAGKDQHPDKKVEVGLDWKHPQENKLQCHQAGTEMETTGEKEPRPSQKQLEEDVRWQGEQSRLHLVAAWKVSPKQTTMASNGFVDLCSGHLERKGLSQVSQAIILTQFCHSTIPPNRVSRCWCYSPCSCCGCCAGLKNTSSELAKDWKVIRLGYQV